LPKIKPKNYTPIGKLLFDDVHIDPNINIDNFDERFGDFIDGFLKKLPKEEAESIVEKLSNLPAPDHSIEKIFKIFPQDIKEEFVQFIKQLPLLPLQNGTLLVDYKPCRIYLGHKIEEEYEKELIDLAKKLGIEVFKMALMPTGYQPISIEEENKRMSQEFAKKAEKYLDIPQYEKAILECNKSIEKSPNVVAYITRGICYSRTGDKRLALEDYKEVIKLDPSNPIAHNNAGSVYREMGEYDLSIEECSIALSEWVSCISAYICLAIVYIDQCKYELAIETIKKGHKNCNGKDFTKRLCENSDFTDALERHPVFLKSFHGDIVLSEIMEFIRKNKKDE